MTRNWNDPDYLRQIHNTMGILAYASGLTALSVSGEIGGLVIAFPTLVAMDWWLHRNYPRR